MEQVTYKTKISGDMMTLLNRHSYLIKERKGTMKNSNTFDIYDSQTEEPLLECIPDNSASPYAIKISSHGGIGFFTVVKEDGFFDKTISLYDETDQMVANFKKKRFSIGAEYKLSNANNLMLGILKSEWDNRNFSLSLNGSLFAQIGNRFTDLSQEIKNTANDYSLSLNSTEAPKAMEVVYAIAAVLCIDMTLKAY